MKSEIRTCPSCGALITPQLARCRQCGTYLHGTQLEGLLFERLLPAPLRASPGTGLLFVMVAFFFVVQGLVAGPESILGFSSYSLRQLGGLDGTRIVLGEYWRFVTSAFTHGGIIHLAFNLYALTIAGPAVEELFDRKKMWLITVISGVLSMVASYVWSVEIMGHVAFLSVGFSGAISGLFGAAIFGGRRAGPRAAELVRFMTRWTILVAVFGLVMQGVDNAAHVGGFVVGAGLSTVIPLGLTQTVAANRVLSVAMLGVLAGVAFCFVQMVQGLQGMPGSLPHDAQGRGFLFFRISSGTRWDRSSQYQAHLRCRQAPADEALEVCRKTTRIIPQDRSAWVKYAKALHAEGRHGEASAASRVVARLRR